jgi:hypothetical protein
MTLLFAFYVPWRLCPVTWRPEGQELLLLARSVVAALLGSTFHLPQK